jgi:hypothetical protein
MPPSGKFVGVDFSQAEVEQLTPDLSTLGQGFCCVRGEFVTYWKQGRIHREVDARISQCWIIRHGNALAGYITLLADRLEVDEQLLENEGVQYRTFPAVKIGLLAADYRAKGAGRRSEEELPPSVPYRTMYLDLKPLIDLLNEQSIDEAE